LIIPFLVIGPPLFEAIIILRKGNPTLENWVESNIITWIVVWLITTGSAVHDRINGMFTLLLHTLGFPGIVVGLANATAF